MATSKRGTRPTILERTLKSVLGAKGKWRLMVTYKNRNTANMAKYRVRPQAQRLRRKGGPKLEFKVQDAALYGRVAS